MAKAATWLSLTPEPERDLPHAVATLAYGAAPPSASVMAEGDRIERLVVRGSEDAWLAYLHGVVELIDRCAQSHDTDVVNARAIATAVISNHHNLLLGLPGRGAAATVGDRTHLAALLTDTTATKGDI